MRLRLQPRGLLLLLLLLHRPSKSAAAAGRDTCRGT
jgi:hypothetical protein